jgi:hypothetical protein
MYRLFSCISSPCFKLPLSWTLLSATSLNPRTRLSFGLLQLVFLSFPVNRLMTRRICLSFSCSLCFRTFVSC